jgi:type II secretory pathway component GspD/PulD (secretin)
VHLEVTPNVSSDSLINLKIHPRILDLTGWTPKGAPIVFERKLNTEVKVKDNTVFVLGGLNKREAVNVRTGVPGFKEVPVLRVFFSVKKTAIVEREVLIFIKPSIYTAAAADARKAEEAVREFKREQEYRRNE